MSMCFCVLLRNSQIKNMRIKNKPFFRNFKIVYLVMFFRIKNMFVVGSQPFSQMHIITVTAKTFPVVRSNFNRSFFYFFKNSQVRKDHFLIFMYLALAILFAVLCVVPMAIGILHTFIQPMIQKQRSFKIFAMINLKSAILNLKS